jgi:GT2 family glycosyltransferase
MRVRAVVLNYDGGPLTLRCLEHLLATDWPPGDLDVWLVDNASTDGVAGRVEARWPAVRVVRAATNLGFAGGCNVGLRDLDGVDAVALVNNDVTVPPDWLAPLAAALTADADVGAASPKILYDRRFMVVDLEGRGPEPLRMAAARFGGPGDGGDTVEEVQFAGGWSPARHTRDGVAHRAAVGSARLHMAVRDGGPFTAELRLSARRPVDVDVRCGGRCATLTVGPTWEWHPIALDGPVVDIVNNTGTVVRTDGYGVDRGWLEVDRGRRDAEGDVFAWCGAAVLMRAEYVRDVGLLDERLFLYYEDLEMAWRGHDRGWRTRYVPASVVRHVHSATAVEGSPLSTYYNERNRLLVLARHGGTRASASAVARFLVHTAGYVSTEVIGAPMRGDRAAWEAVTARVRAFRGYLQLGPAMRQSRRDDARRPDRVRDR